MADFSLEDVRARMRKSIAALKDEFAGLRAGRASASLLEPIMVEAYGAQMPLNQVATISVPEARLINVQVWDKEMTRSVDRAIRESALGLNPQTEGTLIRVPLPELNEERRKEITRVAHQYAEQARVAVRHIRKDGMDALKHLEKDGSMGQDEMHSDADQVQKATDEAVAEIDQMLAAKEQEIMEV